MCKSEIPFQMFRLKDNLQRATKPAAERKSKTKNDKDRTNETEKKKLTLNEWNLHKDTLNQDNCIPVRLFFVIPSTFVV